MDKLSSHYYVCRQIARLLESTPVSHECKVLFCAVKRRIIESNVIDWDITVNNSGEFYKMERR